MNEETFVVFYLEIYTTTYIINRFFEYDSLDGSQV